MELYFLTLEDVLEIHVDQIQHYGGAMGIRNQNLLLSAIAQPLIMFNGKYLHESLYVEPPSPKGEGFLLHRSQ